MLAAAGCKVGPNYKAPTMPAPPAYSEDGHNGAWAAAKPADSADRGAWWTIYGDKELDDLEQRCATSNQSIAAAASCVRAGSRSCSSKQILALSDCIHWCCCQSQSYIQYETATTIQCCPGLLGLPHSAEYLWEPDFWGRIRREIESTSANAQASAAELANTRLSLQGMLAVSFFQLRGIDLPGAAVTKYAGYLFSGAKTDGRSISWRTEQRQRRGAGQSSGWNRRELN